MQNNIDNTLISKFNDTLFYKERFGDITISDFREIPFINAKDVVSLYEHTNKKNCTVFFTSGTTGDPKAIYYSDKDIEYLAEYVKWFCEVEGINGGETVLVLMDQSFWGVGYITSLGHIRAGNTVIPIDNDLPKEKLREIIDIIKPTVISSLPSVLLEVADIIGSYAFRVIETTGEKLTQEDRESIEDIYKGRVFDAYGLTEAIIGVECIAHDGYHFNAQKVKLEIIDADGNLELSEENWGELSITTLDDNSTPIIRYLSGDRCRISSKACVCGTAYPKVWIDSRIQPTLLFHEGYKMEVIEVKKIVATAIGNDLLISAEVKKVSESKYHLCLEISRAISTEELLNIQESFIHYSYELMHMIRNSKLDFKITHHESV